MIDYNVVLQSFIDVARDSVGSSLSTTGAFPSVIRARQKGTKPAYPYITIDVLSTRNPAGAPMQETMPDDTTIRYEIIRELLLSYTVYGPNAMSIAEDLALYFETDSVQERISAETTGQVRVVDDLISIPQLQPTNFVDSCSFNLTFAIIDVKDITSSHIDSAEITGELFRSSADTDPLETSGIFN